REARKYRGTTQNPTQPFFIFTTFQPVFFDRRIDVGKFEAKSKCAAKQSIHFCTRETPCKHYAQRAVSSVEKKAAHSCGFKKRKQRSLCCLPATHCSRPSGKHCNAKKNERARLRRRAQRLRELDREISLIVTVGEREERPAARDRVPRFTVDLIQPRLRLRRRSRG